MTTLEQVREMRNTQTPLPQYQSHKKVWALKIAEIETLSIAPGPDRDENDEGAIITPAEQQYGPFTVTIAYLRKHSPQVGGYWVQYADGYQSWSPAEAFEGGYIPVSKLMEQNRAERRQTARGEINQLFASHKLNDRGLAQVLNIRHIFIDTYNALERILGLGREFSIVKTKLEESCMYAVKAVSLDPENQE